MLPLTLAFSCAGEPTTAPEPLAIYRPGVVRYASIPGWPTKHPAGDPAKCLHSDDGAAITEEGVNVSRPGFHRIADSCMQQEFVIFALFVDRIEIDYGEHSAQLRIGAERYLRAYPIDILGTTVESAPCTWYCGSCDKIQLRSEGRDARVLALAPGGAELVVGCGERFATFAIDVLE